MKYNVQFTLCCFLLLCAATGNAQDFSQDWANYNSYLDVAKETQAEGSVHEFSGAATYSFGFHSLAVDGQSFPISISYFSNGVKVDEYASAVGLGWNLNAGGSITKITRGLDDDDAKGYNVLGAPSSSLAYAQQVYAGTRDGEKDYYVFNAFGLSGSFIYSGGSFVPMNGEKIEIIYSASPSPNFIIKDHSGNSYYFTLQETIYAYQGYNLLSTVKGNWFLTKITTMNGKEINLAYEAKNITGLKTSFTEMDVVTLLASTPDCSAGNYPALIIHNSYQSYRITSITSEQETITFSYETRTDITGDKALQKIEVTRNSIPFKRYLLTHNYISDRLMLTAVIDKNYTAPYAELTLAGFDYYSDYTMPVPLSAQSQDTAGYFNATPAYTENGINSLLPYHDYAQDGANRAISPFVAVIQTLMLKKITNQYGRIQEFIYEKNSYREMTEFNTLGTTVLDGYGVRVSKVISYDKTQPDKKRYTKYDYIDEAGNASGIRTNTLGKLILVAASSASGCYKVVRRSVSLSTCLRVVDHMGVYTHVKTTTYTDANDINGSRLGYTFNEYSTALPVDKSSGSWIWMMERYKYGLLKSTRHYNTANQLVDEKTYTYDYSSYGDWTNVYSYMSSTYNDVTQAAWLTYTLKAGRRLLTESVHKTYSPTAALLLTEKKTYTYDALKYVSQIEVYRNNVLKETTTFKRPQQFTLLPGSTDPHIRAVQELGARKIYSPVLETVTTRNDVSPAVVTAASANLYTYDFTRNIILPSSSYTHRAVDPANQSFSDMTVNNSMVSLSGTYAQTQEVLAFDDTYPAEVKTNGLDYSSAYYTLDGNTYCSFTNTPLSHTAFMGFEQAEMDKAGLSHVVQSGWELVNSCPGDLVQTAYTGTAAFSLSACLSASLQLTRTLDPNRKYRLQFWHKKNSGTAVADVSSAPAVLFSTSTWQLVEYLVENETGLSITGTGIIDDVRLFPAEASCSYATYNGLGLKTSECDASGQCLFYEYDEHYRPLTIKDVRGSILKRFEYGIQEQQ